MVKLKEEEEENYKIKISLKLMIKNIKWLKNKMIKNNLKVNQYRNLDEVEISFHPYFNVFHGLNGQGKTNFIEAITNLSTL